MRRLLNEGYRGLRQGGVLIAMLCGTALASAQAPLQTTQQPLPPVVASPQMAVPLPPPPPPPTPPTLSEAQAAQLRQMIGTASSHGITLPAAMANPGELPNGPELVYAAMNFARALHSGGLAEQDYMREWGLRPPRFDPWPGFLDAVAKDELGAWMASLPPPYTGYDGLRRGLANYRAIEANGGWATLAAGTDLKPGASGARVAALRKRLSIEDGSVPLTGNYDAALTEAVQRQQKRYGLKPTGAVGPQTLAALNVPASDRVRQIIANMERWRWLPAELPTDRVQVNIAAAVLTVFRADSPILSMRAVTGRPGDNTPMLQSQIHSVVLNPPWNVPSSIANRELWPKERANPGYLKRNGYRVIETPGGGKRLQQSSERSALGKYKFDFDNSFAVYLHDTPSQATFDRYARLESHGCVRLARPDDLAKLLFAQDATWTPEAIDKTVASGKTTRARLSQPVSVYLLYWTAFASGSGQMSFRGDPYGWDDKLAVRLAAKAKPSPIVVVAKD